MRWVQLNVPSVLTADAPRRPVGVGTYVVLDVSGGTLQAAAAPTLDAVSTTLTVLAPAGSSTLTLASVAGLVVGRRYLLGGPEPTGGETVTIRSVAGLVVTTVRPLRAAQAVGATLQGTRLSFPVGAPSITTPCRNRRIEWTPAAGDEDLALVLPFDVPRYAPVTYLVIEDLRDLDPLLAKRLSAGTWLPAVIARAWDVLLGHVSQKIDPGGVAGTVDLTIAHGYLVRALLAETAGQDTEAVAYLQIRYQQERDNALGALAYDLAQTGAAKSGAGGWSARSIPLVRA